MCFSICDLLLPPGIKGLSACSVVFRIDNFNQKSFKYKYSNETTQILPASLSINSFLLEPTSLALNIFGFLIATLYGDVRAL